MDQHEHEASAHPVDSRVASREQLTFGTPLPSRPTAEEWRAINPLAWARLLYWARRLQALAPTGRVSMKGCVELVRAEGAARTPPSGLYRIDNTLTAGLARMAAREPGLERALEFRRSHADPRPADTLPIREESA